MAHKYGLQRRLQPLLFPGRAAGRWQSPRRPGTCPLQIGSGRPHFPIGTARCRRATCPRSGPDRRSRSVKAGQPRRSGPPRPICGETPPNARPASRCSGRALEGMFTAAEPQGGPGACRATSRAAMGRHGGGRDQPRVIARSIALGSSAWSRGRFRGGAASAGRAPGDRAGRHAVSDVARVSSSARGRPCLSPPWDELVAVNVDSRRSPRAEPRRSARASSCGRGGDEPPPAHRISAAPPSPGRPGLHRRDNRSVAARVADRGRTRAVEAAPVRRRARHAAPLHAPSGRERSPSSPPNTIRRCRSRPHGACLRAARALRRRPQRAGDR